MSFVDDDRVVVRQPAIAVNFRQQNAVGHDFDQGIFLHAIGEAHLVANQLAHLRLQFLRNARRDAARGDAARLGAADGAENTAFERQANFRQLRGFPRAGLTTNNHHLVRSDGSLDLPAPIGDGQVIAEARLWEPFLAMGGFVFRKTNLLGDFFYSGQIVLPAYAV